MKVVLFGSGLLGQAIFDVFKGEGEQVIKVTHAECDICDAEKVAKVIKKSAPDVVINATGYTKVDKAEGEEALAFEINAKAVQFLAKITAEKDIPIVHFSTDYVFDGENKNGYAENASPAPLSTYGRSKAAGEDFLLKTAKKHYLVRTAWLYGPDGSNFVDTMLNLAKKEPGMPLKVVNDQIGSPTYAPDLAKAVFRLLKGGKYGIYHVVNDGHCSWFEFATEIFDQLGIPKQILGISSVGLARAAIRPKYSILLNTKTDHLRHWKEALKDYLSNKTLIL